MSCRTYDPCLDSKLNQIGSYASVARQSAQASQTSATQSAASASASATSATNSQNSANDSADSASDANNYLTQVENIFNEFEEKYLGAFAIAPTTDNQGNPLQVGALYWNSVTNAMFVWNGSAWSPIQTSQLYLGGFAVAPTLNNQGLPLVSGNLYWNTASNNLWAHNGATWVRTNFNETTPFFTQLTSGSGTARNLENRMRKDISSVMDWGAVGNGTANDSDAIQNAIDNSNGWVFFPTGQYRVTKTLYVRKDNLVLIGPGSRNADIRIDHNGNGIVFEPINAGISNVFLTNCGIKDISVSRPGTITTPADNIWIRQCSSFTARGVSSLNGSTCFRFTGGQLNSLLQCRAFVGNTSIIPQVDNGLVIFEKATLSGGSYQPCYTTTIDDFIGSASGVLSYGIKVKSIDGLNFSNSYMAYCEVALIGIIREDVNTAASAINLTNLYLDCTGGTGGTPSGIFCNHAIGATQYGVAGMQVSNCVISNNIDTGSFNSLVQFAKRAANVNFSNCYFANSGSPWAVQLYDAAFGSRSGKYVFTGNTFFNLSGATGGGALYANDVDVLILTGNTFANTTTAAYQVLCDGDCGSITAIGNIADTSTASIVTIAGIVAGDAILLNAGNNSAPNNIRLALPTSSVGLPSGSMWNNAGDVKIVP
jgi:hypothetical protein